MQTPVWLMCPFLLLLMSIAILPVVKPHLWHRIYKFLSVGLGILVAGFYLLVEKNAALPIDAFAEYVSFVSLLVLLYVASGGMYLFFDIRSTVFTNLVFLFLAAIFSNLIGTTGASILFIRPFMRMNRFRLQAYHVVFFIFIVSNMGGMLTPIADPPLFIGFLKGVPFTWTLSNLYAVWFLALTLCLLVFSILDARNQQYNTIDDAVQYSGKIFFQGKRNLFWLLFAVLSVFIDPAIVSFVPSIEFHGKNISFLREILQLTAAFICYRKANQHALQSNDFNFTPIVEVVYLFFGIFLCMVPMVALLEQFVQEGGIASNISAGLLFVLTGVFSSFLDNAPTYLSMFTMTLTAKGYSIHSISDLQLFLNSDASILLVAVSVSSVVFGAMTYIGNGPNLMVKYIAEQAGVKMPSFGAYILRFSLPILLPIFAVIYLLFFR